MKGLSQN